MISGAYLKRAFGAYGALWLAGFVGAGAAILIGCLFMDLIAAMDTVLPFALGAAGLALGAGVVAAFVSRQTLGTKLVILIAALALVLPLLWAPVSAAVVIAFFAQRAVEYSGVYAGFQIAVAQILYPVSVWLVGGSVFQDLWTVFQMVASVVGFFSALAGLLPIIKRILGPEPATTDAA